MAIKLYQNDLPADLPFGDVVAIDTETMGLKLDRDRLCLVQLSFGDGDCHIVQFKDANYDAPRLKELLIDDKILKIFHFARFDLGSMMAALNVMTAPVFCTKVASRFVRTYTDRHGLKDLIKELLGVDISKQMQSSDWGGENLSEAQLAYAANDVLYLHQLREKLIPMLEREDRLAMAEACFDFLPVRALIDLEGWPDEDIFAY